MTEVSGGPGDLHLATTVINVRDMGRAVDFWCAALGYRPREPAADPAFVTLVHPEGRHLPVSLQLTDTPPREPARIHLDLYTEAQQRHVDRLVGLGATRATDWPYPDAPDFVVLRDPDGNEFCVIDHAGAGSAAPRLAGIFGVKFPVRDLAASRDWYEKVFGLTLEYEFPDDDGVVRGVAYSAPGLGDVGVALRERPDIAGLSGFDPVIFAVDDRAAVDAWSAHLDALGVANQVVEATIGWMVLFHDPDGLEIHLYSRNRGDLDNSGRSGYGRPVGD